MVYLESWPHIPFGVCLTYSVCLLGRQCKNWKGYIGWDVFPLFPCVSIGSDSELGKLLLHVGIVKQFKFCFQNSHFLFLQTLLFFLINFAPGYCRKGSWCCLFQKVRWFSAMWDNWTEGWHPCVCCLRSVHGFCVQCRFVMLFDFALLLSDYCLLIVQNSSRWQFF